MKLKNEDTGIAMDKIFFAVCMLLIITSVSALRSGSYYYNETISFFSDDCCMPASPFNYTFDGDTENYKFVWSTSKACTDLGFVGSVDMALPKSSYSLALTGSSGMTKNIEFQGCDDNYLSKIKHSKLVVAGSGQYCTVMTYLSGSLRAVEYMILSIILSIYLVLGLL